MVPNPRRSARLARCENSSEATPSVEKEIFTQKSAHRKRNRNESPSNTRAGESNTGIVYNPGASSENELQGNINTSDSSGQKRPRQSNQNVKKKTLEASVKNSNEKEKFLTANTNDPSNPSLGLIYPEDHATRPYGSEPGILRIVTWNVASLRSIVKAGALQSYLKDEKPHILCLQETKMTPVALTEIPQFDQYQVHWNHSERKGYSGVAVFVNNSINSLGVSIDHVKTGMGDEVADSEGRVLTLHLSNRLAVVNAYIPNSGGKLARLGYRTETFELKMREFLNAKATDWDVVYCGDLNVAHEEIDIHESKRNAKSAGHTPEERAEFGKLLSSGNGWVDCWRHLYKNFPGYTFYSRRFGPRLKNSGKGWRLDYHVLAKKTFEKNVLHDSFVRSEICGSDHYPLVLDYRLSSGE